MSRRAAATAPLLAAALLAAACATTRSPAPAAPGLDPWQLPPSAVGTQRLFRASFEGPQGGGGFRLTLRLAAADRYRVEAVDPVGRALWTLDVAGAAGLWVDHRNRVVCRPTGSFELAAAQLPTLPLAALPRLLLGRLPVPPAGPVEELSAGVPTVSAASPTAMRRGAPGPPPSPPTVRGRGR